MHPLQLFIRGKAFCDIRSIYFLCVVGYCNTPCTSEGPQCFHIPDIDKKKHYSSIKSLPCHFSPYQKLCMLWSVRVGAYIDDPVCCSRWGQCHILVVSLQGVGRGSADIMLPKQQRERNRERWGIERVFFDSLLAYATWALRDNLQCDTPCSSVLAYSNRY